MTRSDSILGGESPATAGRCAFTALCITPFDELYAPRVASWVTSDDELIRLAPGTIPPLTPAKVSAWGKERANRYLFWDVESREPIGYAELNPMPENAAQMWIGHFLLDPAVRGRSLGTRFAHALLEIAFDRFKATDVLLVVFPDNFAAIRCYENIGFEQRGEDRKHFKATGRTHLLLRMVVDEQAFKRSGFNIAENVPFVADYSLLRQGAAITGAR